MQVTMFEGLHVLPLLILIATLAFPLIRKPRPKAVPVRVRTKR